MADFDAAATCLAGTFTAYITQETAKLTEKVTSIVASFTDPLEAVGDTNIAQIVDGVSDLASGNVLEICRYQVHPRTEGAPWIPWLKFWA